MGFFSNISFKKWLFLALGLVLIQASVLFFLGQPPICTCGYIKLWEGVVQSAGTSQHLSDWYTFSHIIHGILFYGLLSLFFPRMPVFWRLLMAMGIEITWEISENTPYVIEVYRKQALARGYMGDSILNSVSDTCSMILGFIIARKAPLLFTICLVIFLELFVGYMIHDNLTLNILNFIHPIDFITKWQTGQ